MFLVQPFQVVRIFVPISMEYGKNHKTSIHPHHPCLYPSAAARLFASDLNPSQLQPLSWEEGIPFDLHSGHVEMFAKAGCRTRDQGSNEGMKDSQDQRSAIRCGRLKA